MKDKMMAPKVRLTPSQLAVLRHAAAKDGQVWRSESGGTLYDSYDDASTARHVKVNRAVDKLADLDLLRIGQQSNLQRPWHVTDLGRQVLADYPEEG